MFQKAKSFLKDKAPKALYINISIEFLVILTLGVIATQNESILKDYINHIFIKGCYDINNLVEDYRLAAVILSYFTQIYFAYSSVQY